MLVFPVLFVTTIVILITISWKSIINEKLISTIRLTNDFQLVNGKPSQRKMARAKAKARELKKAKQNRRTEIISLKTLCVLYLNELNRIASRAQCHMIFILTLDKI